MASCCPSESEESSRGGWGEHRLELLGKGARVSNEAVMRLESVVGCAV